MAAVGILAAGKLVTIPGVIAEIDASAMTPVSPVGVKIPLFIGVSDGGDPSKVYRFRSFDEAKTLLRSGRILSYIARAFAPSPDLPGASEVRFIRASSTAAQAAWTSAALNLASRDFGFWTNGIRFSIAQDAVGDAALPISYGPTVNFKPWTLAVKNLADKRSFSYYLRSGLLLTSGAGLSFKMDFTANVAQLLNGATVVDEVPFTSAPTLKDLAAWVNGHAGWTAQVVGASWYPTTVLNSGTTPVGVQAIFCPAEAGLAAFLLNSQNPLVSAVLPAAPGPLAVVAETALTGGAGRSYDTIDATALNPALALAATTTAHGLFVQSSALAIQQLALTHCITMGQSDFQKFRVLFTGLNLTGTSNVDGADATAATDTLAAAAAVARAQALDGPAVLCFNGSAAPNPLTGESEQLGGLGVAAQAIGAWAGGRTKDPLTNKPFISQGLEFPSVAKSTKEALLDGGVFTLYFDSETGRTRCVQAITTYQTTNPQFRNLQGLTIQHVIQRMWLSVLSGYIGGPLSLEEGERIKTDCAKALDGVIYTGNNPDGFLTEGRQNGARIPAWESLTVVGDSTLGMWAIDVNAHPVGETDFIRVRTKLTPVPIEI
jgi:hypothetical protein